MTAAILTQAGALARSLAAGTTARELAAVLETLRAALLDEVDDRIPAVLSDAAFALEQLQDELDDEACECPMEPFSYTAINPPERRIGANRYCPVHSRDPDEERERMLDDRREAKS